MNYILILDLSREELQDFKRVLAAGLRISPEYAPTFIQKLQNAIKEAEDENGTDST